LDKLLKFLKTNYIQSSKSGEYYECCYRDTYMRKNINTHEITYFRKRQLYKIIDSKLFLISIMTDIEEDDMPYLAKYYYESKISKLIYESENFDIDIINEEYLMINLKSFNTENIKSINKSLSKLAKFL
jgi:hypothetical protein